MHNITSYLAIISSYDIRHWFAWNVNGLVSSTSVQTEWMDAMKYAERLACESKWSHATYRYLIAAFIIQFLDDERRAALCESEGQSSLAVPIKTDPNEDADGGTLSRHVAELLELVYLWFQIVLLFMGYPSGWWILIDYTLWKSVCQRISSSAVIQTNGSL